MSILQKAGKFVKHIKGVWKRKAQAGQVPHFL